MISHTTTANQYAGTSPKVPTDPRIALRNLLTQHEPHQPLALAAYLNATPGLTDLSQLTDGEAVAMLERLAGNPTYTLSGWIAHLRGQSSRDGAGWLL